LIGLVYLIKTLNISWVTESFLMIASFIAPIQVDYQF